MFSRGRRMVEMVKNSHSDMPESDSEDSPCDDSDADPDFNLVDAIGLNDGPHHFFSEEDLMTEICNDVTDNDDIIQTEIDHENFDNEPAAIFEDEFINEILLAILYNVVDIVENGRLTHRKGKKRLRVDRQKIESAEKVQLLSPCKKSCRKKCSELFEDQTRSKVLDSFCRLNFSQRRLFFDSHIEEDNVKTRTTSGSSKRNCTLKYSLPKIGIDNQKVRVCQQMSMHTLGMKTDGMITTYVRSKSKNLGEVKIDDDRGLAVRLKLKAKRTLLDDEIKEHVEMFNPCVSHYKLAHAPNRRYLTCELTIRYLWEHFCQVKEKISYEKYRKVFETLNIGFGNPTQDDCGSCSVFKRHKQQIEGQEHASELCDQCVEFNQHHERYTFARREYTKDKETNWAPEYNVYTVDMQKVLILPKMSIKNSYFVSRLVIFNETFAPLHKDKNICVIWHEAIRGRNSPDVASTFYNIMKNAPDHVTSFTFWSDNCSAQNKNWLLYSSLACIVNQEWGPHSITMKYFEPGHSFMKADSAYTDSIGTAWKKQNEILDLNDLTELIRKASSCTAVKILNHDDFLLFQDGSKQRRKTATGANIIPLLENCRIVQFREGSRSLFYKTSFEEKDFTESSFLRTKFSLDMPEKVKENRGVNTEKKSNILKILCPHMKPRKKLFWQELPVSDTATDLCAVRAE